MTPEDCAQLLESSPVDSESVTYVLVTGAYAGEVATALGADLGEPARTWLEDEVMSDDGDTSSYAFAELAGGVVAVEPSGYADPTLDVMRRLSQGGRTVAVARSNIQAHCRFGYARDGEIVFDSHEYAFVRDLDSVPAEVRDTVSHVVGETDDVDWLASAMAMATEVTGLLVTAESLERAVAGGFYPVPGLQYDPEG